MLLVRLTICGSLAPLQGRASDRRGVGCSRGLDAVVVWDQIPSLKSRTYKGNPSTTYALKGSHHIRSLNKHNMNVRTGHARVAIRTSKPIGPRIFPTSPTAAISQHRSGLRATSK